MVVERRGRNRRSAPSCTVFPKPPAPPRHAYSATSRTARHRQPRPLCPVPDLLCVSGAPTANSTTLCSSLRSHMHQCICPSSSSLLCPKMCPPTGAVCLASLRSTVV